MGGEGGWAVRPTPETDQHRHVHEGDWCPEGHVPIEVAENLERQRDEARELLEAEKEARKAFAAVHRKCSDDKSALEKQRDRLLEAISLALRTNGGPIDGADIADGEAYVMVRACAFAGLEAVIAEVKGTK